MRRKNAVHSQNYGQNYTKFCSGNFQATACTRVFITHKDRHGMMDVTRYVDVKM